MKKRVQLRGVCAFCGCTHATKKGRMVSHGYVKKVDGYSSPRSMTECYGVDLPHYGSPEIKTFLEKQIKVLKLSLDFMPTRDPDVPDEVRSHEQRRIAWIKQSIEFLTERLEQWEPMELVSIDVDIKGK